MRTVTISLVVELKVAEGVLPQLSALRMLLLSTSHHHDVKNRSSVAESPSRFPPKPGDRNVVSLHMGVGYYIVSSVASNLGGVTIKLHPQ